MDVDSIVEWSIENGLFLNIKKCKMLLFYKGQSPYTYSVTVTRVLKEKNCAAASTFNSCTCRLRKWWSLLHINLSEYQTIYAFKQFTKSHILKFY